MLFLKPFETWDSPKSLSVIDLERLKKETEKLIFISKKQISEYDKKYEYYLKFVEELKEIPNNREFEWQLQNMSGLDKLFFYPKYRRLRKEISKINSLTIAVKEKYKIDNFFYPDFYCDDLAWETKTEYDIFGKNIQTFTSKKKLMSKDEGKNWMIINELGALENYLNEILIELERRK